MNLGEELSNGLSDLESLVIVGDELHCNRCCYYQEQELSFSIQFLFDDASILARPASCRQTEQTANRKNI